MRGIDQLQFLLQHYRQWTASKRPGKSLILHNRCLHVVNSPRGLILLIDHPLLPARQRILGCRVEKGGRCFLRLQGFMAKKEDLLVLAPREVEHLGIETTLYRWEYQQATKEALQRLFSGCRVFEQHVGLNASKFMDPTCLRFIVRHAVFKMAVLAVEPASHRRGIHRALTAAMLWHRHVKSCNPMSAPTVLTLLLPRRLCWDAMRFLSLLNPRQISCQVYAFNGKKLPYELRADPTDNHAFAIPTSSRWPRPGPYACSPILARVFERYPGHFRRFPRAGGGSSFRVRGLEIMRSHRDIEEPIFFGPPDFSRCLDSETWVEFIELTEEVLRIRRYDSREKGHPFYRWQTERWLEEVILCNIERLDPVLNPRYVYCQVPTFHGDERALIDLLAIDWSGRLVVMELKVDPDPGLLMQALDYWDRVDRHNRDNEFERRGYFAGITVAKTRPFLYLVAPVLAFQKQLEEQVAMTHCSAEIFKISVGMNWRRKLTVVRKQRFCEVQPENRRH